MAERYRFGEGGEFIIEGFDRAKTFASFLPGIAGVGGIPMWAFWVNRGQAMASFGVRDKDGAIMEFFPANALYRNVDRQGFRTFVRTGGKTHEPFSSLTGEGCTRRLAIRMNSLRIEEDCPELGLRTAVTYFTMPGEDYAAIVRKVEFENTGGAAREFEILDGLPQMLPHGVTNSGYQAVSNLIRSWFDVVNAENGAACYKVRASTGDTVEVSGVDACNFYLAFSSQGSGLLPPIYDMNLVFGGNTALSRPDGWDCPAEELTGRKQTPWNKASGGFAAVRVRLRDPFALYSVIGHAQSVGFVNERKGRFTPEFIERKRMEAEALADGLVQNTYTKTAMPLFDRYVAQCNLDNLLRGGVPLAFDGRDGRIVYHVFSRKHGDPEREYNFFSLEPGYYSQGNGNYRDVCQNRRCDVLLDPSVGDFDVKHFASLLQADGYNPLLVKGSSFEADPAALPELLRLAGEDAEELGRLLSGRFTPGRLTAFARAHAADMKIPAEEFLIKVLARSRQEFEAAFGEGYWSDHWTYLMDLVDAYLAIWPDKKEGFLLGNASYRFFMSPAHVLPRDEKHVDAGGKVRRYGAVREEGEAHGTCWLRAARGVGEIYETTLFAKLAALAAVKFASLDPMGFGVEMEADRPGWNDAMNGLPGLFGSGLSEAAELKRLVAFLAGVCEVSDAEIRLFSEAAEMLAHVERYLDERLAGKIDDFEYWDRVSSTKEEYREKVRCGVEGSEQLLGAKELLRVFGKFLVKLDEGLARAREMGGGIHPTYFTYRAVQWEPLAGKTNPVNGRPCVRVSEFACEPLPPFLEGPARVMKQMRGEEAEKLYEAVRASGIYDAELGMYKTSAPLSGASPETGRIMAFTPGWLERESVFVHMAYKYLYAMLKAGLHGQFFRDMRTSLIPFLNPDVYGRSTLENSTFIASSMNPDESTHGRGFVARMSGSTAEMLSMWFHLMAGQEPFRVEAGELVLRMRPILPGWLFDGEGRVSFRFLGKALVTYVNPEKRDTFGPDGVKPYRYVLGEGAGAVEIDGPSVGSPWAESVRGGEFPSIVIFLY